MLSGCGVDMAIVRRIQPVSPEAAADPPEAQINLGFPRENTTVRQTQPTSRRMGQTGPQWSLYPLLAIIALLAMYAAKPLTSSEQLAIKRTLLN
ncbi:hypothetical protein TELCIR_00004 [Teladorsagia circumcincta]|uniref:Uncharacterized protein n=1 Tax=Teladorsagia circumcincta TaxID=45464 RepID=A0A2G9V5P3_TELCI|nr:hypothetical protein TELCIR_00004 [Teladorsagia circumcincta]